MGAMLSSPTRTHVLADIDAALAEGKALYALGRSDEALPRVRAALAHARRAGNRAMLQRALTACGILAADAFDIVGGLELHLETLKLVEGEALEQARTWNNIGLAFELAGSPGLAARAASSPCSSSLVPSPEASSTTITSLSGTGASRTASRMRPMVAASL